MMHREFSMKYNTQKLYDLPEGNRQEDAPRRVERKKRRRKWLWLTLLTVLILAGVAAALLWDANAFDGLRRSVIYARAEKDETGCAKLYSYDSDEARCFAPLGGSLAILSEGRLQVLNEHSEVAWSATVHFLSPALVSGGDTAVAYDIGGDEVYVLSPLGLRWQKTMPGAVLEASVADNGNVVICHEQSGHKGAVTVYDGTGEPVFSYGSASRFLMTGALSRDGNTLAAVTMGQETGVFESFLTVYRTDSDKAVSSGAVCPGIVYDLHPFDGGFCAVAEEGLYWTDKNGKALCAYPYNGLFLRRCEVSDGQFAALLLSRYRTGSETELITVDGEGNELGGVHLQREVLDLSASGRYVAVLCTDRLIIYDKFLTELASLPFVSQTRVVFMRADGSAVLAGADSASLYLP